MDHNTTHDFSSSTISLPAHAVSEGNGYCSVVLNEWTSTPSSAWSRIFKGLYDSCVGVAVCGDDCLVVSNRRGLRGAIKR